MRAMLVFLIIFAFAVATATFIENDFGTETAKAVVYNARWFELLLALLAVNLIVNLVRHKLWRKGKRLSLLFHVAFLFIFVGAGLTRYVGHEGTMHIREGGTSGYINSDNAFLQIRARNGGEEKYAERPLLLSAISHKSFMETVPMATGEIKVRYKDFIVNAGQTVVADENGRPILSMMISHQGQSRNIFLAEHDFIQSSFTTISFNYDQRVVGTHVKIFIEDGGLYFIANQAVQQMSMADQTTTDLAANEKHEFEALTLYTLGNLNLVLRDFLEKGRIKAAPIESHANNNQGVNALIVDVQAGGQSQEVSLFGGRGMSAEFQSVRLGNTTVDLAYGSKQVPVPFSIQLDDFIIERYPGSNSPSSFESKVVLIDREKGIEQPYRIYMNHILQHRGYRFFQSSYDQDELGTILSVSYDPGTAVSYIGYLLLTFGLFANLLNKKSRFQLLGKLLRKMQAERAAIGSAAVLLALVLLAQPTVAAPEGPDDAVRLLQSYNLRHSKLFGQLLVQDMQGRIKPIDTMIDEVLNKVSRKNRVLGLHRDQVALGMFLSPDQWQRMRFIKVSNPDLKTILGIEADRKFASFSEFFDPHTNGYILSPYIDAATRKKPAAQNKFDKAVIKLDEHLNIAYMMFTGQLLRLFPMQNDANNTWLSFTDAMHQMPETESAAINQMITHYASAVSSALQTNDWAHATQALSEIKNYQETHGTAVIPSETHRKAEVFFNGLDIFSRLVLLYLFAGLILLVLAFAKILKPSLKTDIAVRIVTALMFVGFAIHVFGLALRWYVSGHAPWSNAYESMIYIAFATVLAGLFFSKNAPMTLAATGILASLILFVAHLSWMDPQITNLVPVLKSYWLVIHVSMITASYGFLGLGSLLAFIALLLYVVMTKNNRARITLAIKELSYINERTLTIGLIFISVGNFLGAVWANESWGRYWGWDPKETWALVTILIYAVVIHLRLIPKMNGLFLYNVAAMSAFSSVVMTYFGVNYYLSGLHSYAKGDPVPIPSFVYYSVATVLAVIVLASRNRKYGEGQS